MTHQYDTRDWFQQPLSDEAAYAIYLFLQEFTMAFEGQYYEQITRHIEDARQEYELELRRNPPPLDEDDSPPF